MMQLIDVITYTSVISYNYIDLIIIITLSISMRCTIENMYLHYTYFQNEIDLVSIQQIRIKGYMNIFKMRYI